MTLTYDIAGSGPTVVLLHSSVCDRRMWQPQWDVLQSAGFQVLRPDFRGFGDTPAPTAPYNLAEDVLALLDSLGLEQVLLVGSSFGGQVAQEVASRWPHRVVGLALICAARRLHPPTPDVEAFGDQEDALISAGDIDAAVALNVNTWLGPLAHDATRELVATMQRHAFEVQLAAEAEVEPSNEDFDLSAVTARTLVVAGAHDLDYFHQIADHLASHIPTTRHLTLSWAGHLPSLESPDRFNPILLDFLAEPALRPFGVDGDSCGEPPLR